MPRIKALFGMFLVVAFIYLCIKMLPPYIQNYQFQQEIQSIARNTQFGYATEPAVREEVRKKIVDLGVPLDVDKMIITKDPSGVTIAGRYTVHIDIVLRPTDLTFTPATRNGDKIDLPPNPNQ
jgi:hypothetical protein